MVATKDPLATRAGLEILEAGGNAVDAAVAACFAVGVVEPASSGIGGGGYLVYQVGGRGGVIGFPMRAPLAARPDMYRLTGEAAAGAFGWAGVVDDENLQGYRSIATPGAVAGLCEAHERLGRLPLQDVIGPSVRLARGGFAPSWFNLYSIGLLAGMLFKFAELRRIFMPGDEMPTGDPESPPDLRQPDLADALEAIGREGPEAYYRGDIAKAIVADVREHGGILSEADLAAYRPFSWENGLEFSYRGRVVRVPPFASAGVTSAMTLKLLDGFDVASMGHNSAEMLHTFVSSARLANADRFAYLADPELVDVPWAGLLSDSYTQRRRAAIQRSAPTVYQPGDPWAEEGGRPEEVLPASRPGWDTGTTHLCVIDGEGNAVSLTNTVGGGFGSGVVPRGTGIVMNNGMLWFDTLPGRVNSILPGKLPLNNMTPALVFDRDGVVMAVGASGGRRITNCVTQLIVKVLDFGMGPKAAVDSPRVDCSMPFTSVDPRLDERVRADLEARGHTLNVIDESFVQTGFASFASPIVISRHPGGELTAGVDTFHSAHAAGL
jgi:gamma-glutamyltranspeptidase/glutathione hydrolase